MKVKIFILILIAGSFLSCLSVEANLQINRDGSSLLEMEYLVPHGVAGIWLEDTTSRFVKFPRTKEELINMIEELNSRDGAGITISSIESSYDYSGFRIVSSLAFARAEALTAFIEALNIGIGTIEEVGDNWEFRFTLTPLPEPDKSTQELFLFTLSQASISLEVESPGTIDQVSGGSNINPTLARFEIKDIQELYSGIPVDWKVTW
ncbi:MAG: hypothetical protein KAU17_07285 [Spirochaetales bacterium]|nr:hypothetical protein [Spirochaetales bacterium]